MFKLFENGHKFNEDRLNAIKSFIKQKFEENPKTGDIGVTTLEQFDAASSVLTKMILEFIGGGTIVSPDNYKGDHKRPSWEQIAELEAVITPYIRADAIFDDIRRQAINNTKADLNFGNTKVEETGYEKLSKKDLYSLFLEIYNAQPGRYILDAVTIHSLYKATVDTFSRRKRGIIIVTICVSAAVALTLIMTNKKKKSKHHDDKYINDEYHPEDDDIILEDDEIIVYDDVPDDDIVQFDIPDTSDVKVEGFKNLFDTSTDMKFKNLFNNAN